MSEQRFNLEDGFEGYLNPTGDEYAAVLQTGLVVVDTNLLLNLYRYDRKTREDLFRILAALGDRLFIPNRVAYEFWTNRQNAIRDADKGATDTVQEIEKLQDQAVQKILAWSNRVALPKQAKDHLKETLDRSFGTVANQVRKFAKTNFGTHPWDTNKDATLQRLSEVLRGKIGPSLDDEAHAAALEEAHRRIEGKVPPGYKDANKEPERAVGDYLIWTQLLQECQRRKVDVLLVTGDVKEDWWREVRGQTQGPRLELSDELFRLTGQRLLMLRPEQLLQYGQHALHVEIRDESVRIIKEVDRFVARDSARRGEPESESSHGLQKLPEGRTADYFDTIVEMTALVASNPLLDDYIAAFQASFPSITLESEARRRMRTIISLGLAHFVGDRVVLTEAGEQLVENPNRELIHDCFMSRISGAQEIGELAATMPMRDLRKILSDDPPNGLTSTQAQLVLRYMEKLAYL